MQSLFAEEKGSFPSTRYQGSKSKIINWIWDSVSSLEFNSVLDVFGGTGAVSYKFKLQGKEVTYNDSLKFNCLIAQALVENNDIKLLNEVIKEILCFSVNLENRFIHENFSEIYFTDDENIWLDEFLNKVKVFDLNKYQYSILMFALFQSCIIKRPYNLFHRKNLYMRFAEVERSFGNKSSWDRPFEEWIRVFAEEANEAVFTGKSQAKVINKDALDTPIGFDLVYIDPPYFNSSGIGTDYLGFYHFLEGLSNYDDWGRLVDYSSKHRRIIRQKSSFLSKKNIIEDFRQLVRRHRESKIVISYRNDGMPSVEELVGILGEVKSKVTLAHTDYQYALSKTLLREVLVIGE